MLNSRARYLFVQSVAVALSLAGRADAVWSQGVEPGLSIESLERKSIEARQAIKSGHVTLAVEGSNLDGPYHYRTTLNFDAEHVREELTLAYESAVPGTIESEYTSTSVIGPSGHFRYSDRLMEDGSRYVLAVDERTRSRTIWEDKPDPRTLGISALYTNDSYGGRLDKFLGAANREDLVLERVEYDGHPCGLVSFNRTDIGVLVKAWIVPDLGHSVVRLMVEFDADGVHYIDDCKTEVSQPGELGLWFPASLHYARTENGETTTEEKVQVLVHSLNAPLPEKLLTLKSVGAPAGTTVMHMYEKEGQFRWDGNQIISVGLTSEFADLSGDSRLRWLLVSVNLAIISALVAMWAWWKRRQT